jgi:hypothetical protein
MRRQARRVELKNVSRLRKAKRFRPSTISDNEPKTRMTRTFPSKCIRRKSGEWVNEGSVSRYRCPTAGNCPVRALYAAGRKNCGRVEMRQLTDRSSEMTGKRFLTSRQ